MSGPCTRAPLYGPQSSLSSIAQSHGSQARSALTDGTTMAILYATPESCAGAQSWKSRPIARSPFTTVKRKAAASRSTA